MRDSSPPKRGTWLEITLRMAGAYVALTSIGFAIWKTTGEDADSQLRGLLLGFLVAATVLLVGSIVQLRRGKLEAGLLALLFMAWALFSAWSVVDRLARAFNRT